MQLEPGDLIADHSAPPESAWGLMIAINEGLVLESLPDHVSPCRLTHLHRRGLQAQLATDRLAQQESRQFELYRLTPVERFSASECATLLQASEGMILDSPLAQSIPSAVAIALLLQRMGKMPRCVRLEFYTCSELIGQLFGAGVYHHIPHDGILSLTAAPKAA